MGDPGFSASAAQAFGFLVGHGFQAVPGSASSVRFESAQVVVDLIHDASRSYELRLLVSLRQPPSAAEAGSFELHELLLLKKVPGAERYWGVMVDTAADLAHWLERFAEALQRHGDDFLRGDATTFRALKLQQQAAIRRYNDDLELRQVRPAAESAWQSRDYAKLVKLWAPLRARLGDAERKKLEYAERKSHH